MRTKNLNDALLELTTIITRTFPRNRKSDLGQALREVTGDVRHYALTAQLGGDGDPRDLVKLALKHCGEKGVPLQDVAELINEHQEAHAGLQEKAS